MPQTIELRPLKALGDQLTPLVVEAEGQGFRFMQRLRAEWEAGENRFEAPGELLLGAYVAERLVAVGGVNVDPYAATAGIGRLRHVYVLGEVRRLGIGTQLVQRLKLHAAATFSVLRLRTTTKEAAAFYERLGFRKATDDVAATHIAALQVSSPAA